MKRPFLVALDLTERRCLVVGRSPEAARRAMALLDSGARVTVIGENPCPELEALAQRGSVELHARSATPTDLDGTWLAVVTDAPRELAEELGNVAAALRVWFCAVDRPEHNSYAHVAIARAGPVSVGISTGGRAPALGRRLREELERVFDEADLERFAQHLAKRRTEIPPGKRGEVLGRAVAGLAFEGRLRVPDEED
ncbi:MAG TPA: NAD(P)-dependent oxidoreductase [Polyangiaceae bacterium]|nr:NAD(P)-dependent oxidoreductase [Polyangiaceae bacterium]